jgi:hybrid cluster-associated redox disulfide protein
MMKQKPVNHVNATRISKKMKKIIKITKKTTFAELVSYPKAQEILASKGLACFGCPMAQMETIEQGALAHGINPDDLIKQLNKELK